MKKRLLSVCLVLIVTSSFATGVLADPEAYSSPTLLERVYTWLGWNASDSSATGASTATYPILDSQPKLEPPTETTSTEIEEPDGELYPSVDPNG